MTKILYYNYFIIKEGNCTNASIIPLLEHILSLEPKLDSREKEIAINGKLERVLLTEIHSPSKIEINNTVDSDAKIITFSRKRKKNPYVANDGSDKYEQIPESRKVLELATALVIPRKNLILLQRNIHSTSIKLISRYLSEFLNDDITIKFEPVTTNNDLNDVLNSKLISRIEFKFSTEKLSEIMENVEDLKHTPADSVFVELLELQNKAAGITKSPETSICFSKGRFHTTLSIEESVKMIRFIQAINPDDSPLKSIKIKYKSHTLGAMKEVDLVADGILSFNITLDSNGGEYVGNNICKTYYDTHQNLYKEEKRPLKEYVLDIKNDFI